MVDFDHGLQQDLAQMCKMLSDTTRLRILHTLANEAELHVTALCDRLELSQPAISHHLGLLRLAGLIEGRREGKHNFYSLRKSHVSEMVQQLSSAFDLGQDAPIFEPCGLG